MKRKNKFTQRYYVLWTTLNHTTLEWDEHFQEFKCEQEVEDMIANLEGLPYVGRIEFVKGARKYVYA